MLKSRQQKCWIFMKQVYGNKEVMQSGKEKTDADITYAPPGRI